MICSSAPICPSCSSGTDPLAGYEAVFLRRCATCGLVFDSRTPSSEDLENCYRNYTYATLKPCPEPTVRSFTRLLSGFEQFRRTGKIFDMGCGQGDFLFQAQKLGWNASGSEYSPAAIELCSGRGLKVIKEPITAAAIGIGQFDVVTSFEVIEHTLSPGTLFENARMLLRNGGLLYLTTPNFNAILRIIEGTNFRIISYPEHLCLYTRRSMRHLARRHGFAPQKVTTSGIDLSRMRAVLSQLIHPQQRLAAGSRAQTDLLRTRIESNPALRMGKKLANTLLGYSGTGDTLKAWLVKDSA